MDFREINTFLNAKNREIKENYGFDLDGRTWALVRATTQRAGSLWPLGGFRRLDTPSKFVKAGETTLGREPFDELANFKLSCVQFHQFLRV